jgi:hypothetical protein
MQSRTSYSLVASLLLTAMACAHQLDPEDTEILDDGGDDAGSGGALSQAGTPSKGGTGVLPQGGTGNTSKGGTSALPTGKAGTKSTAGSGGKASGGAGGSDSGGTSDGGTGGSTVHMPVVGMAVQFKAQDTSESPVDFFGGELFVINDTAQPFTLTELKIRYYFTNEVTNATPSFTWQWGQFGPKNNLGGVTCSGTINALPAPKAGADSYVEFTCSTAGELSAGPELVMSWKVGAQGMGKMLQADDYSFAAAQADNEKIVVMNGDTVVWGLEP